MIVLILFLGGAEAVARLLVSVNLLHAASVDNMRSAWGQEGWAVDPLLGWTLVPLHRSLRGGAVCWANSYGLRDREIQQEKPQGEFRVLSVGDSTVLGFGVQENQTFSSVLERKLAGRVDRPVEVINAGTPGYTSTQVLLFLKYRGIHFEPDVVVVETNFNDRRAIPPGGELDSEEQFRSTYQKLMLRELLDRSMLARVLRYWLLSGGSRPGFIETGTFDYQKISVSSPARVSLRQYEANMREIVDISRAAGASVIFVGLPDEPTKTKPERDAEQLLATGEWEAAEAQLRIAGKYRIYTIINQLNLNRVLQETGRSSDVSETIPVNVDWMSSDGYLPVTLGGPYIDVLRRLGEELDVRVVIPQSSKQNLYIDYIHLNSAGHGILATQLADTILPLATGSGRK